jgi:hypothetical protein
VRLDGHDGSYDFFRNLPGTESETNQLQHFELPICKSGERIGKGLSILVFSYFSNFWALAQKNNIDALLNVAEKDHYQAKETDRNKVVCFAMYNQRSSGCLDAPNSLPLEDFLSRLASHSIETGVCL